ncbi:uncharacterized protein K02A2.6-like [Nematostella vectensis]|uniref:uncharacterized protein K02A2.6-like n=1 Tax=Nematostella vectensis TaxID=45351 RepID=UPI002076D883|nr:uncharacterized protein K02A2.6-like [Nematostella vectensis]
MGGCLIQEGHPVIYASRSLTDAERNYAQIEKELLAIVFTCERFHQFIYGNDIIVHSDHKPLEAIMAKPLSQAPCRIQRLLIRLQKYNITVRFVPEKEMFIADTLSRAFLIEDTDEQQDLNEDIEIPATTDRLLELKHASENDVTLQELRKQLIKGWPSHKREVKPIIAPYWTIRDELSEAEGLLFKGNQLIIPTSMRETMLNLIHESHLGIEKCKARARAIIYWPGMSRDIYEKVSKCKVCMEHQHKNIKEPMLPHERPERPWQKVGSDLMELKGKDYLVVVDYYSKFIEVCLLRDKTAATAKSHMKSIFARHGIPEELVADNVPYNSKEFKDFAKDWNFKLTTCSPRFPQSNGRSEKAVQIIKRILKKSDDPYIALLEYRNTPVTGMSYSPAQLLMSRTTRSKLPVNKELLVPSVPTGVREELKACQDKQAKYYFNRGAKPLAPLTPNEGVRVYDKKKWIPATVKQEAGTPRSYIIQTETGQGLRRNRRHLLKTNEQAPEVKPPEPEQPDSPTEQPTAPKEQPELRRSNRSRNAPTRYGYDE